MGRFKGFTLTELMVALAVIGILVAVVTPAIVKNRPNKNKMMVKKSFYTVEQVVNSMVNNESLYPDMRNYCGENADTPGNPATDYCAYGFDYIAAGMNDGFRYSGNYKFAQIFKDSLNVRGDYTGENNGAENAPDPSNPDSYITFYPIFYTTDGIKWDLTGTKNNQTGTWHSDRQSVGTFTNQNDNTSGIGVITVDVNGEEGPNAFCTAANDDCDQYSIQILANGKLRINPDHARAVNYASINTSIRDD